MESLGLGGARSRIAVLYRLLWGAMVITGSISMAEIKRGINDELESGEFERRTFYNDLVLLNDVSPLYTRYDRRARSYRVALRRAVSDAELSILVNAVLSARFDSQNEAKALVEKLYQLAGYEKTPAGAHHFSHRVKLGQNSDTSAKLDVIHAAIDEKVKIIFDYQKYNAEKQLLTVRQNCLVSPYRLLWQNDRLYLVGHYGGTCFAHYRIERMADIRKTKDKRDPIDIIVGFGGHFDEAEYMRRTVGLSRGEMTAVEIRFQNGAAGEVLDSLGVEARLRDNKDGTFTLHDDILLNKKFIRWLLGFGAEAEVVYPKELRDEVAQALTKAGVVYKTSCSQIQGLSEG